ncbi:hypothetical protein [Enterococcus sp. DIV0187]|uniref:hypothetical protein n=1 Tax=Enterococcus sp. DIV0187 TaxID=2774644 RepID=UPI003F1EBDE7
MNKVKGSRRAIIATLILLSLVGCTSEAKKAEQYVQNMLEIVDEVDSEMKELSKTSMSAGEISSFNKSLKQKQDEVKQEKVPDSLPKAVKDCKDNLYDGIGQIRKAASNDDSGLIETGQFNISMAEIIYKGFLDGKITKKSDDGKTETERSKEWEDELVDSRKKTIKKKDYYGEWETDDDSDVYMNLDISDEYVEDISTGNRANYTFNRVRTINLSVKQIRKLFGEEKISGGSMMLMLGEQDKSEMQLAGHYFNENGKKIMLLSTLTRIEQVTTESSAIEGSSGASEEAETSQNESNSIQMPRDPAELAGTGTPKSYDEFNEEQQKAIGKAVDAVTNNIGVDRTIYNYTYEPDILSGTIYVGRFNGNELMDVISLDDKLLDYKGILDASAFAQLKNQSIEQFISGYNLASSTCSLGEKDGRVVIYFTLEEKNRSNGDKQKVQQYIELTRRVSNDVKNNVKAGVPVSLQEPFESDYSVTFVDGKPTSASPAYQLVIDKMRF